MRSRGWGGAHMSFAWAAHEPATGGSDTGCPMPIRGSDIRCHRGYPGGLVSNPGSETMGEGRKGGTDGLLLDKRPKEGRKAGVGRPHPLGKEKPVGVSLRGVVSGLDLLTVAGEG